MEGLAYYNGKTAKCDDITIPLTDRLIYFGDGIYDVIAGHSGKLFLPMEHIDRLFFGMNTLHIKPPLSKDELQKLIQSMIKLSGYDSYIVYISVSRNAAERVHSYLECDRSNLLIIIRRFKFRDSGSLKLIITEDKRYSYCNIKTINLLPSVLAATKAQEHGCDEAIFIRDGKITECSHSNIFIIKDESIITHPNSNLILPGIIRNYLIKIAAETNVNIAERAFTKTELFEADEIIVTSTTKLIQRASSINGISVGGKAVELFDKLKQIMLNSYLNI